jgi:hypothetical protein
VDSEELDIEDSVPPQVRCHIFYLMLSIYVLFRQVQVNGIPTAPVIINIHLP